MSLRWLFLVLLVAWGVNAFGAIENFNQIIVETITDQETLASEIQTHMTEQKEETLESKTDTESVASEGFKSNIIRN